MIFTNFVGPFDPFTRPAPGRPPGSKHLWEPRLDWYRSRPGAGRKDEYPNGSNIKYMRFVMIFTNFVGPFDPFRRPAPGRPPDSKHLGGLDWVGIGPVQEQAVRTNIQTGQISKICVL